MNWTLQNAVLFATALQAGLAQLGSRFSKRIKRRMTIVVIVAVTVMAGQTVSAQITSSGQQAPPSLKTVTNDGKGQATDDLLEIPVVGRSGRNIPGVSFLE